MSGDGVQCTSSRPKPDFERSSIPPKQKNRGRGRAFSLWLSPEEEAELAALAGEWPWGAYLKKRVFTERSPIRKRRSYRNVEDKHALAMALALLGRSRFSSNLNQLAKAANIGTLPLTPEVVQELHQACDHISEIKSLLVEALGLKSGGQS